MKSNPTIPTQSSRTRPWLIVGLVTIVMIAALLLLLNASTIFKPSPANNNVITHGRLDNGEIRTDPTTQHINDKDIIDRAASIYHDLPDDSTIHGTIISAQGHTLLIDDRGNNQQIGIRLIGVDVPSDTKDAQQFIDQRIQPGSPVVIQYDPEIPSNQNKDPNNLEYTQAYVWFYGSDTPNRMLNAELLAGGWAKQTQLTTGYSYGSEFKTLESEAEDNKLGLWAN